MNPLRALAFAEISQWLRGVVDALLDDPGGLYNPLYVGPVQDGGLVAGVVASAAEQRLLPFSAGATPPTEPGVWLSGVEGAETALAEGSVPVPGVQWIVWGGGSASGIPDRLAGWVGANGLGVDPLKGAAEPAGAWSMRPVVMQAARSGLSGDRHFIVVVGGVGDLVTLSAELQFQLELELGRSVWRGPVAGWAKNDSVDEARVMVVSAGADPGMLCGRLAELPPGPPWGIVADVETALSMAACTAWAVIEPRVHSLWRSAGTASFCDETVFPKLSDVLAGGCRVDRGSGDLVQFSLGAVSLAEILQAAEGWVRSGRLIAFAADRVGWVRLGPGRVCGARIWGGREVDATAEGELFGVLATIAEWNGASVVFVPGVEAEDGVPIGRAIMAVAHGVGTTTGNRQGSAGLGMRVHEVAAVLVESGIPDIARSFLQRTEEAIAWGAEEDVLLGNLSVDFDPQGASARLRHGAVRAFSEREDYGGMSVYVDGTLNALLVEVRGGETPPSVAWTTVGTWIREVGAGWVSSPRRAAIWLELALRAGELASARDAQALLRALAGDVAGPWSALLGLRIGSGGVGHV